MITISLCMIVKNEEDVLARCLESSKNIADEIIIVDTGSNDKTKKIAAKYTDKVFDFTWVEDFSKARNFAFSKATKDYQMWLDADDVITEENVKKILELKKMLDPSIDIVTFKYNTHFDELGNPILTSTRGRLFKRDKEYLWNDPVHEYITLKGNIYHAEDIFISHRKEHNYTDRNLKIYQKQIKEGKQLSPRSTYYYARELMDNKRFEEAIYYFESFLDSNLGWIEDNICSCFNLYTCCTNLKNTDKAFSSLCKSFKYAPPRAEICCCFGYYYKEKKDFANAISWFLLATKLEKPNIIGFILNDYWDFIPFIELSLCYYNINDITNAMLYNKEAEKIKPNSNIVIQNHTFFSSIIKNKDTE